MLKYGDRISSMSTISEEEVNAGMPRFESFTHRMFLDYCDENDDWKSEHMSYEEYYAKYEWWLLEQYERENRLGCK